MSGARPLHSLSVAELRERQQADEEDAAEREAIALEAGARPVRARAIARCEVAWRSGAACTCGLHVEAWRAM